MSRTLALLVLLGMLLTAAVPADIVPPVLVWREAIKDPLPLPGRVLELDAPTSTSFVLYLPDSAVYREDGSTTLTIHFHGAAWFVQQEHERRGARHPLLVANAREGDGVFEEDIMRPGVMDNLLAQVEGALRGAGGPAGASISSLELSGFSAGYAGVRGVLRLPRHAPMVARVLLSDSLYVGDGPGSAPPENRLPRTGPDGIGPFVEFARRAARGDAAFLMEFSTTPSMRSVGPKDCARAIIAELGVPIEQVAPDSLPAARSTADYQLAWRADAGGAHFWCYDSPGRPIHLAHVRNMANMWRALEGETSAAPCPPAMPPRAISPTQLPGRTIALDWATTGTATLFLPDGYKAPADGNVEITVHFHGAAWFVFQEHLRRGAGEPIVALELGQGSTVYRVPFEDPERLGRLLDSIAAVLREEGAPESTTITAINITSFSAGYGAVREIVKSPRHVALIRRIILGDSSYGSLDEQALARGDREVLAEHVEPWAAFARLARAGDKTLLMLTSDITPPTYAGTHEVARAVAKELGLEMQTATGCPSAADGLDYPLHTRADDGAFHWWAYGGEDAIVHMTIARHIADAWDVLDQYGNP